MHSHEKHLACCPAPSLVAIFFFPDSFLSHFYLLFTCFYFFTSKNNPYFSLVYQQKTSTQMRFPEKQHCIRLHASQVNISCFKDCLYILFYFTVAKDTDFYHFLRYASCMQNVWHVPTISIQSFKCFQMQNL